MPELADICTKSLVEFKRKFVHSSKSGFHAGFRAGFQEGYRLAEQRAEKREVAYAAFLRGQLTQDQLDEVLNG